MKTKQRTEILFRVCHCHCHCRREISPHDERLAQSHLEEQWKVPIVPVITRRTHPKYTSQTSRDQILWVACQTPDLASTRRSTLRPDPQKTRLAVAELVREDAAEASVCKKSRPWETSTSELNLPLEVKSFWSSCLDCLCPLTHTRTTYIFGWQWTRGCHGLRHSVETCNRKQSCAHVLPTGHSKAASRSLKTKSWAIHVRCKLMRGSLCIWSCFRLSAVSATIQQRVTNTTNTPCTATDFDKAWPIKKWW